MSWYEVLGLTAEHDFSEDQLIEHTGFVAQEV